MTREKEGPTRQRRAAGRSDSPLPGDTVDSERLHAWEQIVQEHLQQCRQLEDALQELLNRTNQSGE